jgi:hypothetical protein
MPATAAAAAAAAAAAGAKWWWWPSGLADALTWLVWLAYETVVTGPLRAFYFEGPIWQSQPPEEICFGMTGVEARHWKSSPENAAQCELEMERRFHSWDKTVMTSMYFAALTVVLLRLLVCCFGTAPAACRRAPCDCELDETNTRRITREELARLLAAQEQDQEKRKKKDAV